MANRQGFRGGIRGMAAGVGGGLETVVNENLRRQHEMRAYALEVIKGLRDDVLAGKISPDQYNAAVKSYGFPAEDVSNLAPSEATREVGAMEPVAKATSEETFPTVEDVNTRRTAARLAPISPPTPDTEATYPFLEPGSSPSATYGAKRRSLIEAAPVTKVGETTQTVPGATNESAAGPLDYQPVGIYGSFPRFGGAFKEEARIPSGPSALTAGAAKGAEQVAEAPGKGQAEASVEAALRPGKVTTAKETEQALMPIRVQEAAQKKRQEMQLVMSQLGMLPEQMTVANQIADDFEKQTAPFRVREDAYSRMMAFNDDPSPAGDIGIIYSYMQILDPGSHVLGGEYALAQNAAGVPDQIRNTYNRLISGEKISVNRGDYLRQSKNIYDASKRGFDSATQTYGERAAKFRLPAALVTRPVAPLRKKSSTIPGAEFESRDGGTTWTRVK